jgi:hypothetical protein
MSNFMEQFRAGFQMGQTRNENTRRNQELQMEQQRQMEQQARWQQQAQREMEAHDINIKASKLALEKAKLDQQITAHDFAKAQGAEQGMQQMQASAAPGGQFTRPGAAPIQGMGELAGPPAEGVPTQPAMAQIPGIDAGGVSAPAQTVPGIELLKQLMARRQEELQQIEAEAAAKRAPAKPERPISVAPGGTLFDPDTNSVVFKAPDRPKSEGGGGGLSEVAESNVINRLSGQWSTATKTAGEINRQVNIMEVGLKAARRGDLAAGSQAVLVTFQKILDPTSVVRESEYARSAQGQALIARMEGAIEQLQKGGAGVPVSELEKFAQVAREMAQGTRGHLNATKERIGKVADRYKIPRELVIEDYDYGNQGGASGGGEYEPTTVPGVRRRKIQR